MTTPTKAVAIDPAALNLAVRFLQFDDAMAGDFGKLPDPIIEALNAATTAYVRSRRDPATFRETLLRRLPAVLRAVDVAVKETLQNIIKGDVKTLRDPESLEDRKQLTKELGHERAVYAWLFPKTHEPESGCTQVAGDPRKEVMV